MLSLQNKRRVLPHRAPQTRCKPGRGLNAGGQGAAPGRPWGGICENRSLGAENSQFSVPEEKFSHPGKLSASQDITYSARSSAMATQAFRRARDVREFRPARKARRGRKTTTNRFPDRPPQGFANFADSPSLGGLRRRGTARNDFSSRLCGPETRKLSRTAAPRFRQEPEAVGGQGRAGRLAPNLPRVAGATVHLRPPACATLAGLPTGGRQSAGRRTDGSRQNRNGANASSLTAPVRRTTLLGWRDACCRPA